MPDFEAQVLAVKGLFDAGPFQMPVVPPMGSASPSSLALLSSALLNVSADFVVLIVLVVLVCRVN